MNKILKITVPNGGYVYYIREENLARLWPDGHKLMTMSEFVVDAYTNTLVKCRVSLEHLIDGYLSNET